VATPRPEISAAAPRLTTRLTAKVSSLVIPDDLLMLNIDHFLTGREAAIRPPDQLRDVAPEAGSARLRESTSCFAAVLSSITGGFKPNIADGIVRAGKPDAKLIN
jgi:hypothetical protein